MTRLLTIFESDSLSSFNLLLKLKGIGLLEHPHLFVLSGVADSPSLLHAGNFSLEFHLLVFRLSGLDPSGLKVIFGFPNFVFSLSFSGFND